MHFWGLCVQTYIAEKKGDAETAKWADQILETQKDLVQLTSAQKLLLHKCEHKVEVGVVEVRTKRGVQAGVKILDTVLGE